MDTFNSGLGVGVGHPGTGNGINLDTFDADLAFDDALLDNVNNMPSLPFTPAYEFETFSTTFEDPFPYSAATTGRPFELQPHDAEGYPESSSPPDMGLDNKLLCFSEPVIRAAIVDETCQFTEPAMSAELFGMFFLAEDVYAAENIGRPLELTCYRRNLWWCSGQVTLPRTVSHVVTGQGRQIPVLELAASISAVESIEGKPTEIISIPWKSAPANNSSTSVSASACTSSNGGGGSGGGSEEAKALGSPPTVPIDLANGQEVENGRVSVPLSWKRLQFKHATANNGRRKGQQQHYVVQIQLQARIAPDADSSDTGEGGTVVGSVSSNAGGATNGQTESENWLTIAEIQSGPVIVRGRSPRNFVSRRDVPLSSSGAGADKKQQQQQQQQQQHLQQSPQVHHAQHTLHAQHAQHQLQLSQHQHQQHQQHPHGLMDVSMQHTPLQSFQRYSLKGARQSSDWAQAYAQQSPRPAKKVALSPTIARPPVPPWNNDTSLRRPARQKMQPQPPPPLVSQQQPQQQPPQQQYAHQRPNNKAVPINLSLSEDERSPSNRVGSDPLSNSPSFGTLSMATAPLPPIPATSTTVISAYGRNVSGSVAHADDDDDLLYEYFPLSLDDWMPPVDAIYRPHAVHHTVVITEAKAQQVRNKSKRYFAAD